jgi:hypothetical protein
MAYCLLINFKKRGWGDSYSAVAKTPEVSKDPNSSHYIMFGYYDEAEIVRKENWLEFNPEQHSVFDRGSGCDRDDASELPLYSEAYQEIYPLKLICPKDIDYDFVVAASCEKPALPFFAVAMLHISETAMRQLSAEDKAEDRLWETLDAKIKQVIDSIQKEKPDVSEYVKYGVFHTIGFSDMVILFQTSRLDMVSDIVYRLRGTSAVVGKGSKEPFLCASYSLCGLQYNFKSEDLPAGEANKLYENMQNIRLSVRFMLRPGITPQAFYVALREETIKRAYGKLSSNSEETDKLVKMALQMPDIKSLPNRYPHTEDYIENTVNSIKILKTCRWRRT